MRGVINGRYATELVLDTGAERIGLSSETARRAGVRPVSMSVIAGVGAARLPAAGAGARRCAPDRHAARWPTSRSRSATRCAGRCRAGRARRSRRCRWDCRWSSTTSGSSVTLGARAAGQRRGHAPADAPAAAADGARPAQLHARRAVRRRYRRRADLDQHRDRRGARDDAAAAHPAEGVRLVRAGTTTRSCCPASTSTSATSSTASSGSRC